MDNYTFKSKSISLVTKIYGCQGTSCTTEFIDNTTAYCDFQYHPTLQCVLKFNKTSKQYQHYIDLIQILLLGVIEITSLMFMFWFKRVGLKSHKNTKMIAISKFFNIPMSKLDDKNEQELLKEQFAINYIQPVWSFLAIIIIIILAQITLIAYIIYQNISIYLAFAIQILGFIMVVLTFELYSTFSNKHSRQMEALGGLWYMALPEMPFIIIFNFINALLMISDFVGFLNDAFDAKPSGAGQTFALFLLYIPDVINNFIEKYFKISHEYIIAFPVTFLVLIVFVLIQSLQFKIAKWHSEEEFKIMKRGRIQQSISHRRTIAEEKTKLLSLMQSQTGELEQHTQSVQRVDILTSLRMLYKKRTWLRTSLFYADQLLGLLLNFICLVINNLVTSVIVEKENAIISAIYLIFFLPLLFNICFNGYFFAGELLVYAQRMMQIYSDLFVVISYSACFCFRCGCRWFQRCFVGILFPFIFMISMIYFVINAFTFSLTQIIRLILPPDYQAISFLIGTAHITHVNYFPSVHTILLLCYSLLICCFIYEYTENLIFTCVVLLIQFLSVLQYIFIFQYKNSCCNKCIENEMRKNNLEITPGCDLNRKFGSVVTKYECCAIIEEEIMDGSYQQVSQNRFLLTIQDGLQLYFQMFREKYKQALNLDPKDNVDVSECAENTLINMRMSSYAIIPFVGPFITIIGTYMNSPNLDFDEGIGSAIAWFINVVQIISLTLTIISFNWAGGNKIITYCLFAIYLLTVLLDSFDESHSHRTDSHMDCNVCQQIDDNVVKCKIEEEQAQQSMAQLSTMQVNNSKSQFLMQQSQQI